MSVGRCALTLLAALASPLAACSQESCRQRGRTLPGAALVVEFAGCQEVHAGPVCMLGESRDIRIWARAPASAQLTVWADATRLVPSVVSEVMGGQRLHLTLPEDATTLQLRLAAERPEWTLALDESRVGPDIVEIRRLRRNQQVEAAERHLARVLDSLQSADRARAESMRAGFAMTRGAADEVDAHLRSSQVMHREAGCLSCAVNDALALAYHRTFEGDYPGAERALADANAPPDVYPEGEMHRPYYAGLLAFARGDLRTALRLLQRARDAAERLGDEQQTRFVREVLAELLLSVGRSREAGEELDALLAGEPSNLASCARADALNNAAWARLVGRELGVEAGSEQPSALLHQALDLFRGACPEARKATNVRINLALDAVQRNDVSAAARWLSEAESGLAGRAELVEWHLELTARVAQLSGNPPAALSAYDDLAHYARRWQRPSAQRRAALGRARVLRATGRAADALLAYEQAEELLGRQAMRVGIDQGRDSFAAVRAAGTGEYIELLLEGGHPRRALQVARRARRRAHLTMARLDHLASLSSASRRAWDEAITSYRRTRKQLDEQAAAAWQLSAESSRRAAVDAEQTKQRMREALDLAYAALPLGRGEQQPERQLAPGELWLVFYPLPEDAGVAFARDASGVRAERLALPAAGATPARLGRLLLDPFDTEIATARQISVLASGPFAEVDLHALPWRDAPLVAHAPVAYRLDLPVASGSSEALGRSGALVVADPRGNLSGARQELERVREALAAAGLAVRALRGETATRQAVMQGLSERRVFHYAGHGEFRGVGGWESALPLARDSDLGVGDLLTLERAPELVVLAGCETGRAARQGPVLGLGLAAAFLLRGTQAAIAASRTVSDEASVSFVTAFYNALSKPTPAGAMHAFRAAASASESDGWEAFRIYVP